MRTVDVRLLVHDDDTQYLLEQLISATHGVGAPLGAVEIEVVDQYSDGRLEPIGLVVIRLGFEHWDGQVI